MAIHASSYIDDRSVMSNAVDIVPAVGYTYPELLFRHKNLENIQGKNII